MIQSGRFKNIDELYDKLYQLPPIDYLKVAPEEFDEARCAKIGQGEGVIVSPGSLYSSAKNCSVSSCLGITIVNEQTGEAALLHLYGTLGGIGHQSMSLLVDALEQLRKNPQEPLSVHIIGDYGLSDNYAQVMFKDFITPILETLCDTPNLAFKSFDVGMKRHPSDFIYDAKRRGFIKSSLLGGPAEFMGYGYDMEPADENIIRKENIIYASNAARAYEIKGGVSTGSLYDLRGVTPHAHKVAQKSIQPASHTQSAKVREI